MLITTMITSIVTKRHGLISLKENQCFKSYLSKKNLYRTIELWEDNKKIQKWFEKSVKILYISDKAFGSQAVSPSTYFNQKR
jgi:hypothetical protein